MNHPEDIDGMIRRGQTDEAITRLNRELAETPQPDAHLYYLLGNAYRKQGDFAQALNCYLEAISINPDSPAAEAHRMLTGIIEFYHKDYYNP